MRKTPFDPMSAPFALPEALPFEGGRLRRLTQADLPRLRALVDDYGLARMLGGLPHPYRMGDAEAFLALVETDWPERQNAHLVIHLDKDKVAGPGFAGVCSLFKRDAEAADAETAREIGYWIGRPFWGKGHMTRAAEALITWGASALTLDRIEGRALADNPGSIRVLEKLGFMATGERRRDRHPVRKVFADMVFFVKPLAGGRSPPHTATMSQRIGYSL